MADLATIGFVVDPTGVETGVRRMNSALDSAEKKIQQLLATFQGINKKLNVSFSGGVGSSGSGGRSTAAEFESVASAKGKAADAALRYAQALARLHQAQGNTAQASQGLSAAINSHTGSTRLLISAQTQLAQLQGGIAASQRQAASAAISQAQATARLQVAQGNAAGAARTLQAALASNTGSAAQNIRIQTQLAQILNAQSFSRYASTIREAGESIQQAGYFLAGLSAALIGVGQAAVKSAFEIDKNVNVLRALLGGTEAAEKRFAALVSLSQKTPGLTANVAATIDAQLRVAGATEQAINRVLPAIGRLNAVSNIQDPQRFVQNLVQLVTQNFERIDLKELVGQSPLAGELIKQIFNVDSPINGEAIRASAQKLGLTTVDAFFTAFGEAAAKNAKLANITESIATQFAKLADRVTIALRPLGQAIIDTLGPIVERSVIILEKLGKAFADLPEGARQVIIVFGALAIAIGPVVIALGALIQTAGAIGNLVTVFGGLAAVGGTLAGVGAALLPLAPLLLGIAAVLGVAVVAWATYESAADRAAKVTAESVASQLKQINSLKALETQARAVTQSQDVGIDRHARLRDVISQLDPETRAYIDSIRDEQLATRELNRVIEEQIRLRSANLSRNFGDIGAGSNALTQQIAQAEENLARVKRLSDEFARGGGQPVNRPSAFFTPLGSPTNEQNLRNAQDYGKAIQSITKDLDAARAAQASFGESIDVVIRAGKLSIDSFVAQQLALGRTEDEVNGLRAAYEAFKQSQLEAANRAFDTTNAINAQTQAVDFLIDSLSRLNSFASQKVTEVTREIALRARNETERKALLKQRLALDDDFFFAVQERNRVARNEEANRRDLDPTPRRRSGAGAARRIEAEARAIRAAEESFEKARAEARFDIQEKLIRNLLEAEKDAFEKRLTSADAYYKSLEAKELRLNILAQRRVAAEINASQRRLSEAKPGTPEAIREQEQIVSLHAQLRVLELERPNILRRINNELEKAKELEKERFQNALAAGASFAFEQNKKFVERFTAREESQFDVKQSALRVQEIELQGLVERGILRERDARDLLIQTQRKYRDELIKELELEQLGIDIKDEPGKEREIAKIEEKIAAIRNLGSELTRTEALQRRFAEQGILHYDRLNEGVEDLLAEQKGLTEIFQDFRANQVRDAFSLIERGVDALTRKFGLMGDAVGQLLKDLLKLAATELFKKLFGIGQPSAAPQLGFGGGASGGGGGFSLGSLLGLGGGGGGGGFGSIFTPPFNPAAASGAPTGGIPGIGGGGFNIGGLLSRLPGLRSIFGSTSSTAAAARLGSLGFTSGGGDTGAGVAFSTTPGAVAPSLFSALGAGGLLAGGGLLGSLIGGKSQIGRLVGGLGGSILGGVAGASGIFGSGIAGALPALFTNPITAIIGGALIGGALLFNLLGNKTLKSLRGLIRGEYAVDVKSDKILEQVKAIGENKYGKNFKRHQIETVRLPETRDIIYEYAQRTGQPGNSKLFSARELQDPFNAANRFTVRREFGGSLLAGQAAIVGERRPEVFQPTTSGHIFPNIRNFEQGVIAAAVRAMSHGPAPTRRGDERGRDATLGLLAEAILHLRGIPAGHLVQQSLEADPDIATRAVERSFNQRTDASNRIRDSVQIR